VVPTYKLYVAQFAEPPEQTAYTYVGFAGAAEENRYSNPKGASDDLSHIVFGEPGVSEWVDGIVRPVGFNGGEDLPVSVGSQAENDGDLAEVDAWHAVSADGSRVYFTSPAVENGADQLYVRVNAEQPQSPLVAPEANATATVTAGSTSVTEVTAIAGAHRHAQLTAGSTKVTLHKGGQGTVFYAGQPISEEGGGIPAGTTIVAVSAETSGSGVGESLTLSAPAEASETEAYLESTRAESFVVGEQIAGYGLPLGATVTGWEPGAGTLTLSAASDVSAGGVALVGGGECTEAEKACTIDISASRRATSDTHGVQSARYWGASTGPEKASESGPEKVFFTSNAELTEDAYTDEDKAANLYEYNLGTGTLTDLTGEKADNTGEGAAVQGVAQISEDGAYVYYVAKGALKGEAGKALKNSQGQEPRENEDNLYVSRGGEAGFITTLSAGDSGDWDAGGANSGGPDLNAAVVDPSGTRLAFISEKPLTGYNNEPAAPVDCTHFQGEALSFRKNGENNYSVPCSEVYVYNAAEGTLVCASCNPSGARPQGPATLGESPSEAAAASYRPRNFSEGGVLFFDSYDALAGAAGGVENVFEYEDGGVRAISNVTGGHGSFFLVASASGGDVFFASEEQLVAQDVNSTLVVYDARVDGGFPVTAPACTTAEACRNASPSTPPVFGPPPSATFSGPGNLAPPSAVVIKPKPLTRAQKLAKALKVCAKDKQKSKRAKCQKQAKQKYGVKKSAKKSSHNGRTKS
jgi:hypothetical protein